MVNNKIYKKYPMIRLGVCQITNKPGIFCMSYGFDNTDLEQSVKNVGIINNPYIMRNNNEIEIVTGYRRILALKRLEFKEVECLDLTDSGMNQLEIIRFALHDNLFTRELNLVEKSMILNRLNKIDKNDEIKKEIILSLKINFKDYTTILWIDKLDESIKDSIARGNINIKALERLIHLTYDDTKLLIDWINKLNLNYNYQVQFIDIIIDICRIEKISLSHLLDDDYFKKLCKDSEKNIPQKSKEFMEYLKARRNPHLIACQKLFEKRVNKLKLPKNIKINHPGNFESEGYKLEIDFKKGVELKKDLMELLDEEGLMTIGDPWVNE